MVIIVLTDIHGRMDYLPMISKELTGADLVLIAGDITHFGGGPEAESILSALRQYNPRILAVPGNCDRSGVDDYLKAENMSLNCGCVSIDGITFVGMGGSLPCLGNTPNESGEDDFERCLKQLETKISSNGRVVLVTHQPAKDTVVDTIGSEHIGSRAVADFITRNKPLLAVSGHVHEAVGVDHIGETTLVNPGPFRQGKYAYIELNQTVDKIEIRTVT